MCLYFKILAYIIDYKFHEKKYETSSSYTFPCSFTKKNFTRLIQRKSVLVNVKSSNNISFIKISKVREIMPSGETNENATLILPIVEDFSIPNQYLPNCL